MRTLIVLAAAVLAAATAAPAAAQTPPPGHGAGHSPYVGQQATPVRGLSLDEIHALRSGEGMGFARPAELNGYPGPRHVLDLADALALSAGQRAAVAALFAQMQAEAVAAGERYLATYAALEQAFRDGTMTLEALDARTAELGRLEGELRAVHLKYHLATRALLADEQVAAYTRLRGYDAGPTAPHAH
jgi:hypothetical protein